MSVRCWVMTHRITEVDKKQSSFVCLLYLAYFILVTHSIPLPSSLSMTVQFSATGYNLDRLQMEKNTNPDKFNNMYNK